MFPFEKTRHLVLKQLIGLWYILQDTKTYIHLCMFYFYIKYNLMDRNQNNLTNSLMRYFEMIYVGRQKVNKYFKSANVKKL